MSLAARVRDVRWRTGLVKRVLWRPLSNAHLGVEAVPVGVHSTFNANASPMAISAMTLVKFLHGAEKSSRMSENLAAVEDFCSRLQVLPYGPKAAQHYGAIRAALEKLGQPIGVNDMHIAAHARSEGLMLVTNNMGEFARAAALETENWVQAAQ